ncbi:hypothetical protein AAIG39_23650, partial [Phytobacter palmae]
PGNVAKQSNRTFFMSKEKHGQWPGGKEEDVTRLVMNYMPRKSTIIDRVVPARLLLKQRRKLIQEKQKRLIVRLDNCTE